MRAAPGHYLIGIFMLAQATSWAVLPLAEARRESFKPHNHALNTDHGKKHHHSHHLRVRKSPFLKKLEKESSLREKLPHVRHKPFKKK